MYPPLQYLSRQVQIHPPEADVIAGEINTLIRRCEMEYAGLPKDFIAYMASWTGRRQMVFCDFAYPQIGKLSAFIEKLKEREKVYREFKVTVWEEYTNPEWEAYMRNHPKS
jgi:hypothetical protein